MRFESPSSSTRRIFLSVISGTAAQCDLSESLPPLVARCRQGLHRAVWPPACALCALPGLVTCHPDHEALAQVVALDSRDLRKLCIPQHKCHGKLHRRARERGLAGDDHDRA
eukprot:1541691-Pyramimonas_sp.AAC.1